MTPKGKHKLSTESYKGVRDFYPEDMFIHNYILNTMRDTVESFGFEEYSASILEPAELYEAKTGEEIVNEQTYTFTDRGDRRVTLRPEMTPSVARLVAQKKRELTFPLRWYSIPNVFRYERPQRGRLREHWQLNCDIFSVPTLEADIEIISLASSIMQSFGAKEEDFEIRVNNRESLSEKLDALSVDEEKKCSVYRLLDKRGKVDNVDEEIEHLLQGKLELNEEADKRSEEVIKRLKEAGVQNVLFDPNLVRGFDYYTGTVFEVFDTSPQNNRSLFGGGRYDNLLDIFGAESVPAVGFGMGDVTMRDFLETHGLLPEYIPSTDLYIATQNVEYVPEAQKLAQELRTKGVSTATNLLDKKLGEQIKTASKQAIPFVLVLGEEELQSATYTIKNLSTGSEQKVELEAIADVIWSDDIENEE